MLGFFIKFFNQTLYWVRVQDNVLLLSKWISSFPDHLRRLSFLQCMFLLPFFKNEMMVMVIVLVNSGFSAPCISICGFVVPIMYRFWQYVITYEVDTVKPLALIFFFFLRLLWLYMGLFCIHLTLRVFVCFIFLFCFLRQGFTMEQS